MGSNQRKRQALEDLKKLQQAFLEGLAKYGEKGEYCMGCGSSVFAVYEDGKDTITACCDTDVATAKEVKANFEVCIKALGQAIDTSSARVV